MNLTSTLKKAVGHIEDALAGDGDDILDTLKKEHREADELLKKLVDSDSAAERRMLLKKLKAALVPHLKAEQKVVYDAVGTLKDKDARTDGAEGVIEHRLAAETLGLLGKIDNALSPEFSAAAKVLKELIEHHVAEEERNIWSDVREHFSGEERREMNRAFEAAKKKVKVA